MHPRQSHPSAWSRIRWGNVARLALVALLAALVIADRAARSPAPPAPAPVAVPTMSAPPTGPFAARAEAKAGVRAGSAVAASPEELDGVLAVPDTAERRPSRAGRRGADRPRPRERRRERPARPRRTPPAPPPEARSPAPAPPPVYAPPPAPPAPPPSGEFTPDP